MLLLCASLFVTACSRGERDASREAQLSDLLQTTTELSESLSVLLQAEPITSVQITSAKRRASQLWSQVLDTGEALQKENAVVQPFWLPKLLGRLDTTLIAVHARASQGSVILSPDEETSLRNALALLTEMQRLALDLQSEQKTATQRLSSTLTAWEQLASDRRKDD